MSNKIKGRNVIARIYIDDVAYPVFCARTATFTSNQDEIEVTHRNSGPDRQYIPGMGDCTLDVTGTTTLDNTNGRVAITYLLQAAQRRTVFDMDVVMTDDDGNTLGILFSAFSRTRTINRATSSYSDCLASFRITGGLTFSDTILPPVPPSCEIEEPLYLTLAEGSDTVSDPLLEVTGVVILKVARETLTYTQVSGSPTTAKQFRFTGGAGNGTIEFLNDGNPGGEDIYILYKIET